MTKTTVIYHQTYQHFTELDENGNIIKEGKFKIPERVEKIIENELATVVFLKDVSKGVSLCHPLDVYKFDETLGRKLAYLRAKIVSMTKEIKIIQKATYSHK